jgi:hypothetical protein
MKKRNIYFIGLMFLTTVLGSSMPIFAAEETSSMMCDEGVVNIGNADADVLDTCGQPDSQSMNEWVYDFGPSQPVYTVIFKDGKVVRILESERSN